MNNKGRNFVDTIIQEVIDYIQNKEIGYSVRAKLNGVIHFMNNRAATREDMEKLQTPYYETKEELEANRPNATEGSKAWVGDPYPGTTWVVKNGKWTNTGVVPPAEEVNLELYAQNGGSPKSNQDLDNEKANKDDVIPLEPLKETIRVQEELTIGANSGSAPGNPFGGIYFIWHKINGKLHDFNFIAGEAGKAVLILYRETDTGLVYVKEINMDCVYGNNIVTIEEDFIGYIAVRCITAKFKYDPSSTAYPMKSMSVPSGDPNPSAILWDKLSDAAGSVSIQVNITANVDKLVVLKNQEELEPLQEMSGEDVITMIGQSSGSTPGNIVGTTYFLSHKFSNENVEDIRLWASLAGLIHILFYEEKGNDLKLLDKIDLVAVLGLNVIEYKKSFSGYIALLCPVGKFRYNADYRPSMLYRIATDGEIEDTIAVNKLLPMDGAISLEIEVKTSSRTLKVLNDVSDLQKKNLQLDENMDLLTEEINQLKAQQRFFKKVGTIVSANFRNSNLPDKWTNVGFTSTADGLKSPATGGISTAIEYDQYSNLDSFITTFRMNMASASHVLLTNHHKKYLGSAGHVVGFDMSTKKLTIYEATAPNVVPSIVLKQEVVPFNFVAGDVMVRYERNAMLESYTISNGSNSFTMNYDTQVDIKSTGGGYDKFGLVFLSGSVTIQSSTYSCQLAAEPDILIVGNSICNGDTIRAVPEGGYLNRWTGRLAQKTLVSQWALGGNTVGDINRDLDFILSMFKPNKVIYGVGINDSVLSTFISNCETFITKVEAIGAEPILQTLFPRSGREQYCADVSAWVKNSGYRYIDFRKRMTVDGLGITRRADLFAMPSPGTTDNLHPAPSGHKEMAVEVDITLDL